MPASQPLKLFIIYAREDQPALLELKAHLRPLEKRGDLAVWYDGEILPGQDWGKAIKEQLATSDIVMLFISKHFFSSEYIEKVELKGALERHHKGEATVVPVIVKPCLWDAHEEISALQVLPKEGIAVSKWVEMDEAWEDVARGLLKIIQSLKTIKPEGDEKIDLYKATKRIIDSYNTRLFSVAFQEAQKFDLAYPDLPSDLCLVIGKMHFEGKGTQKNYDEAVSWLKKSAELGNSESLILLGTMYRKGDGVNQDNHQAFEYYFLAARLGNSDAQYRIGIMYETGTGVDSDIQKAIDWYLRAEANGNSYATNALIKIGYKKV